MSTFSKYPYNVHYNDVVQRLLLGIQEMKILATLLASALLWMSNPLTAQTVTHPACQQSSSDSDGDGWGWENNASCIVVEEPIVIDLVPQVEPMVEPMVATNNCLANSATTLAQCLSSGQNVILTGDITCDRCSFIIRAGLLNGNGYTITRNSGQMNSNLIRGSGSNYGIVNLTLDEGSGPACFAGQGCPRTVQLTGNNISISNVTIRNSKAYTLAINRANDVSIERLALIDGGIVGLIIENNSNRVSVSQSTFTRVGSNSIAVTGANNVVIENNTFTNNHLIGFFPVAPQFGTGFTGGGQVYLASGNNITFMGNTVVNGSCDNCIGHVSGVELGFLNNEVMDSIVVVDNDIRNNTGPSIAVNRNVTLTNSVLDDQFVLRSGAVLNP